MLTNVGHRFGHQSGLDESSEQKPAAVLNVFAFFIFGFPKISIVIQYTSYILLTTTDLFGKGYLVKHTRKNTAASLFSRTLLGDTKSYRNIVYVS